MVNTDRSNEFAEGYAAGIEAAATWLAEQARHYPEDIFVPPPRCTPGHTHDFDYSAPEQRCTICQRRPGTVDCYAAAMARNICKTWPGALREEAKLKTEVVCE
jgi:hypothetical protein